MKIESVLNKIERFNNVLVGTGSNVTGNILMFFVTMLLTNLMTSSEYGEFRLLFTFSTLLVLFLILGRDSLVIFLHNQKKSIDIIQAEVSNGFLSIFLGTILLFSFAEIIHHHIFGQKIKLNNLYLALFMAPLWAGYNLLTPILRISGYQNVVFLLNNFFQRVIRSLFLLLFVIFFGATAEITQFAMILSQCVLFCLLLYITKVLVKNYHFSIKPKDFRTNFSYSLSLCINSTILYLFSAVSMFILNKEATLTDVAIFDIVFLVFTLMLFPFTALMKSCEPYLTMQNTEMRSKYLKNYRVAKLLIVPSAVFIIIFGSEFLVLFGPEYSRGAYSLRILMATVLITVICGASSEWLSMNKFAKVNTAILGTSLILNISLGLYLSQSLGLLGGTIAFSCSILFHKVCCLIVHFYKAKYTFVSSLKDAYIFIPIAIYALFPMDLGIYNKVSLLLLIYLLLAFFYFKELKEVFYVEHNIK